MSVNCTRAWASPPAAAETIVQQVDSGDGIGLRRRVQGTSFCWNPAVSCTPRGVAGFSLRKRDRVGVIRGALSPVGPWWFERSALRFRGRELHGQLKFEFRRARKSVGRSGRDALMF